jgi:hypothetical protein
MKRIKTIIFLCFAATMAFIAFSGCQRSLVVDFEPLTAPYSDVSLTTETQNSLPLLDRDLPLLTGRTSPSPGTTIPPATGEHFLLIFNGHGFPGTLIVPAQPCVNTNDIVFLHFLI